MKYSLAHTSQHMLIDLCKRNPELKDIWQRFGIDGTMNRWNNETIYGLQLEVVDEAHCFKFAKYIG